MLRKLFLGLTILDAFSKYLGGPMGDLGELNVLISASDGKPVNQVGRVYKEIII